MILDFGDKTTEDIFHGHETKAARRIPRAVRRIATRKLDMLNATADLRDLRISPANRLEALKGDWAGYHSFRVNDQYRVVFKWIDGSAKHVQITDYH